MMRNKLENLSRVLIPLRWVLLALVLTGVAQADPNGRNVFCVVRQAGLTPPPSQGCQQRWVRLGVGLNGCNGNEVSFFCPDAGPVSPVPSNARRSGAPAVRQSSVDVSEQLQIVRCRAQNEADGWWTRIPPVPHNQIVRCQRRAQGDARCRASQSAWLCDIRHVANQNESGRQAPAANAAAQAPSNPCSQLAPAHAVIRLHSRFVNEYLQRIERNATAELATRAATSVVMIGAGAAFAMAMPPLAIAAALGAVGTSGFTAAAVNLYTYRDEQQAFRQLQGQASTFDSQLASANAVGSGTRILALRPLLEPISSAGRFTTSELRGYRDMVQTRGRLLFQRSQSLNCGFQWP